MCMHIICKQKVFVQLNYFRFSFFFMASESSLPPPPPASHAPRRLSGFWAALLSQRSRARHHGKDEGTATAMTRKNSGNDHWYSGWHIRHDEEKDASPLYVHLPTAEELQPVDPSSLSSSYDDNDDDESVFASDSSGVANDISSRVAHARANVRAASAAVGIYWPRSRASGRRHYRFLWSSSSSIRISQLWLHRSRSSFTGITGDRDNTNSEKRRRTPSNISTSTTATVTSSSSSFSSRSHMAASKRPASLDLLMDWLAIAKKLLLVHGDHRHCALILKAVTDCCLVNLHLLYLFDDSTIRFRLELADTWRRVLLHRNDSKKKGQPLSSSDIIRIQMWFAAWRHATDAHGMILFERYALNILPPTSLDSDFFEQSPGSTTSIPSIAELTSLSDSTTFSSHPDTVSSHESQNKNIKPSSSCILDKPNILQIDHESSYFKALSPASALNNAQTSSSQLLQKNYQHHQFNNSGVIEQDLWSMGNAIIKFGSDGKSSIVMRDNQSKSNTSAMNVSELAKVGYEEPFSRGRHHTLDLSSLDATIIAQSNRQQHFQKEFNQKVDMEAEMVRSESDRSKSSHIRRETTTVFNPNVNLTNHSSHLNPIVRSMPLDIEQYQLHDQQYRYLQNQSKNISDYEHRSHRDHTRFATISFAPKASDILVAKMSLKSVHNMPHEERKMMLKDAAKKEIESSTAFEEIEKHFAPYLISAEDTIEKQNSRTNGKQSSRKSVDEHEASKTERVKNQGAVILASFSFDDHSHPHIATVHSQNNQKRVRCLRRSRSHISMPHAPFEDFKESGGSVSTEPTLLEVPSLPPLSSALMDKFGRSEKNGIQYEFTQRTMQPSQQSQQELPIRSQTESNFHSNNYLQSHSKSNSQSHPQSMSQSHSQSEKEWLQIRQRSRSQTFSLSNPQDSIKVAPFPLPSVSHRRHLTSGGKGVTDINTLPTNERTSEGLLDSKTQKDAKNRVDDTTDIPLQPIFPSQDSLCPTFGSRKEIVAIETRPSETVRGLVGEHTQSDFHHTIPSSFDSKTSVIASSESRRANRKKEIIPFVDSKMAVKGNMRRTMTMTSSIARSVAQYNNVIQEISDKLRSLELKDIAFSCMTSMIIPSLSTLSQFTDQMMAVPGAIPGFFGDHLDRCRTPIFRFYNLKTLLQIFGRKAIVHEYFYSHEEICCQTIIQLEVQYDEGWMKARIWTQRDVCEAAKIGQKQVPWRHDDRFF